MTCIVGYTDGKHVVIGGDSAGVANYSIDIRADEKVFIRDGFIFGFTSSFRMGQLLRYNLVIPKHPPKMDTMTFMVKVLVPSIRKCFRDEGYMEVNSSREEGGTFLVGYKGELFSIQSDFQVAKNINAYDAIGCGADIAKGSLFTTRADGTALDVKVEVALNAAEAHSAGVSAPFVILTGGKVSTKK